MPLIETPRAMMWAADGRTSPEQSVFILIHGAGGNRLQWSAPLRKLAGVGVVTVDLPGHEGSPLPGRDSLAEYAEDVIALMDTLGIRRAVMVGHSMGGGIALTLAIAHPARVAGLILLGTGAKLGIHPDLLDAAQHDAKRAAQMMVEWSWGDNAPQDIQQMHLESLVALHPGVLYGDLVGCNAFDVRARLGEIAVPSLVVCGTQDRMTPPRYSEYLRDHVSGAELVMVEAGHMLVLERVNEVGRIVAGWLESRKDVLTE